MLQATVLASGWTTRMDSRRTGWRIAPEAVREATVPARVPGCVHDDLLAAGLLVDPYLDANEKSIAWVGHADWVYETLLEPGLGGHERADLVFDGLDTFAQITLGGTLLGRTHNMHRGYRFDATAALRANVPVPLSVHFTSAYAEAEALRAQLGPRPSAYPEPFNFARKMACSFGWDWGPTLVTAGIWRPVRVERWSVARLDSVRPTVRVDADGSGVVEASVRVERSAGGEGRELLVRVRIGESESATAIPGGNDECDVRVLVPRPRLWWPHTLGAQELYDLTVELLDARDGAVLDTWNRRVGFRDIALDTGEDEHGSAFTLSVNGRPIFARGVNWIPDDALVTRVTPARYRRRLEQARAANVDLVRVWGGGIYEDEAFYEACDELGLLVWQDFAFACAAYPEEEPLAREVEAEARYNVERLMPHPSLALWNGNNENLWGYLDWGWQSELNGRSWGEGYYLGLLPRVVAEIDPARPYWAGTPWSGDRSRHPNDPAHGTVHSWEVWNREDYARYRDSTPRFVGEFGWQAPPALATLRRAVGERPLDPAGPGIAAHQKAEDGAAKLARGIAAHFEPPAPGDLDRWHFLTQLTQARAVAAGIEHWRAAWPVCAGTVLWQLNDCWPAVSWSAIDGDGRLKPLYHELRRVYADHLLSFHAGPRGELTVALSNLGTRQWTTEVRIRRVNTDGSPEADARIAVTVPANAVRRIAAPPEVTDGADVHRELWIADADDLRAVHLGCPDREFEYPPARWSTAVQPRGNGMLVIVTAQSIVRDLLLRADVLAQGAETDRDSSRCYRVNAWNSSSPDGTARTRMRSPTRCVR